jgi:hypothetical protein
VHITKTFKKELQMLTLLAKPLSWWKKMFPFTSPITITLMLVELQKVWNETHSIAKCFKVIAFGTVDTLLCGFPRGLMGCYAIVKASRLNKQTAITTAPAADGTLHTQTSEHINEHDPKYVEGSHPKE